MMPQDANSERAASEVVHSFFTVRVRRADDGRAGSVVATSAVTGHALHCPFVVLAIVSYGRSPSATTSKTRRHPPRVPLRVATPTSSGEFPARLAWPGVLWLLLLTTASNMPLRPARLHLDHFRPNVGLAWWGGPLVCVFHLRLPSAATCS